MAAAGSTERGKAGEMENRTDPLLPREDKAVSFDLSLLVGLAALAAAIVIPLLTTRADVLNLLFLIFLFMTLGQSWNILAGFAGQVNLGHAAFFGTGAMVTRNLWLGGTQFLPSMVIGAVAAVLLALVVGLPTFRLRGVYFSLGTLAVAEAIRITVGNALPRVTALPAEMLGTYDLAERYYLALGVAVATMVATWLLLRSRLSLGILAVREDEDAARATGVDALKHKLMALTLSSFLAGLAGATFAYYQVSYYPELVFTPVWTFDPVLITFVGGVGTLIGPVIGAIFFVLVRELLAVNLVSIHQVIFGALFIVVVLALPGGLVDLWSRFRRR